MCSSTFIIPQTKFLYQKIVGSKEEKMSKENGKKIVRN